MMMEENNINELPLDVDLADIYGVQEGKNLSADGTVSNWSIGIVSNYIPCSINYTFELKITANTWNKVAFFDEELNFISTSSLGKYTAGTYQFGRNTAIEIPSNAKQMLVQLKGSIEGDYYIKRIA